MICRSEPFDWNAAPDTRDTRPDAVSVRFCGSCGQSTVGAPCSCTAPAEPTHEPMQLFTPAPTPMRGQTTIEGT